jgi:hypothetical protein
MLSYVTDLEKPNKRPADPGFIVKNVDSVNLSGKAGNYNTYFNGDRFKGSTYVSITKEHYRNFGAFTKTMDGARETGVTIERLLKHTIQQIKGTINNPISSRSILVYDFEVNLIPTSPNPIFVPFLIYDLPGKEDISRTYVKTGITRAMQGPDDSKGTKRNIRRRVFADIARDTVGKVEKSTYVLNPLLLPIFDNNIETVMNFIASISTAGVPTRGRFDATIERTIARNIMDFVVTTFSFPEVILADGSTDYQYSEGTGIYPISDLYDAAVLNPGNIQNLPQLFDEANFNTALFENDFQVPAVSQRGITPINILGATDTLTKDTAIKELRILVAIILIGFLIQNKFFDVVAELIHLIVMPNSNNPDDGGWTTSKIYAFFEAYYINENVIGLLQYLIQRILEKTSDIPEQFSTRTDERISNTLSKCYSTANKYRTLDILMAHSPDEPINDDYSFRVTNELLTDTDRLKQQEIAQFITTNNVDPTTGEFAYANTIVRDAFARMCNAVAFENVGKYDSNYIFRKGVGSSVVCDDPPADKYIINPRKVIKPTDPDYILESNRPLLQDFIEPYEQNISFYYIFYVVSNSQELTKAEEQVKLLNNSMPFINKMDPVTKKKACAK